MILASLGFGLKKFANIKGLNPALSTVRQSGDKLAQIFSRLGQKAQGFLIELRKKKWGALRQEGDKLAVYANHQSQVLLARIENGLIRLLDEIDDITGGKLLDRSPEMKVILPNGQVVSTRVEVWQKGDRVYMKGEEKPLQSNNNELLRSSDPKKQRRINTAVIFLQNMNKTNEEINQILSLVDLSKGISIVPIKKGEKVWRFERVNSKIKNIEKHFFTDAYGADGGVRAVGFTDYRNYELVTYEVIDQAEVLKTKIKGTGHNQFISDKLQYAIKEISREKATN